MYKCMYTHVHMYYTLIWEIHHTLRSVHCTQVHKHVQCSTQLTTHLVIECKGYGCS